MSPAYDPSQQFKLFGPDGRIIATGSMSALTERVLDSKARSDAISLINDAARSLGLIEQQQQHADRLRQREDQLRARQVAAFCDSIGTLTRRFDACQKRCDAEEFRQIQAMIDQLPDPDAPEGILSPPPSGELHTLGPSQPGEQSASPDQGDLPRELTKDVPPPLGSYPEYDLEELSHPQHPPAQPVAISLNAYDDD